MYLGDPLALLAALLTLLMEVVPEADPHPQPMVVHLLAPVVNPASTHRPDLVELAEL